MEESILKSVKKFLGLAAEDTSFDLDVMMHINTVFTTLNQLGVGPAEGFMIEDNTSEWSEFIGADLNLNAVKTYVYLRVRLLFDPPATSFAIAAVEKQIQELEWRLNVTVDTRPVSNLPGEGDDDGHLIWIVDDTEPLPAESEQGDLTIDPDSGDVWRIV